MTTSSTNPKVSYSGNSSTTNFPITFSYSTDTEIQVDIITNSTNAVSAKTNPSDYTIVSDEVVFGTAPITGETVIITLNTTKDQQTDYQENDSFPAETHEAALDKLTRITKELNNKISSQVPLLPVNLLTNTEVTGTDIVSNNVFKIDSTGTKIELGAPTSTNFEFTTSTADTEVDAAGKAVLDIDGDGSTVQQSVLVTHDGTNKAYLFSMDAYPTANNQVPVYDSSANKLKWATASGTGIGNIIEDITPQLGNDLDTNSYHIQFDTDHGISDDTGNEQLHFTSTGSAVNYLNITNAATGNSPTLEAKGDDTNISLTLSGKGTGEVSVTGNFSADDLITVDGSAGSAGALRLSEDSNNGSNYVEVKSPDSLSGNVTFVLPSADGSADQIVKTDGSGNLSFTDNTSGKVLQVVQTVKTDTYSTTTTSATDITGMSVTITPTNSSNKILILASVNSVASAGWDCTLKLLRGSTEIGSGDSAGTRTTGIGVPGHEAGGAYIRNTGITYLDSPSTTSATTYKLQSVIGGGTFYLNRSWTDTDSAIYSRTSSSIIAIEIDGT